MALSAVRLCLVRLPKQLKYLVVVALRDYFSTFVSKRAIQSEPCTTCLSSLKLEILALRITPQYPSSPPVYQMRLRR